MKYIFGRIKPTQSVPKRESGTGLPEMGLTAGQEVELEGPNDAALKEIIERQRAILSQLRLLHNLPRQLAQEIDAVMELKP